MYRSFIGALNFYTKFLEKLHVNLKPFYNLLHANNPWKWTDEHERLFRKLNKLFHPFSFKSVTRFQSPC